MSFIVNDSRVHRKTESIIRTLYWNDIVLPVVRTAEMYKKDDKS
jgi:hypothetical protein